MTWFGVLRSQVRVRVRARARAMIKSAAIRLANGTNDKNKH